jgi:hypothetical protein
VWGVTLRRCREAGLRVHTLQSWRDVDTYADLAACRDELEPAFAPHTARVLRELTEQGIVGDEAGPRLVASELLAVSRWRAVVSDQISDPPLKCSQCARSRFSSPSSCWQASARPRQRPE